MYSVTINGNNIEELYANMAKLLQNQPGTTAPQTPAAPVAVPPAQAAPTLGNPIPPAAPASPATPTMPPVASPVPAAAPAPTVPAPAVTTPPAAPFANNTNPPPQAAAPPPAPVPPAAPAPPAVAPTYTLDQLAKAGAALAQTGKMEQALALLAKYGVQTVNQLPPEQYGNFATELRALGAQV